MLSDVLIVIFSIATCLNGWNRGLSRSLRGLLAAMAAVLAAPYVYPYLAAWLYSRIDLDLTQATVIAYITSLFVLTAAVTAILVQLFNSYWEDNPWLVDRLGGFVFGGIKAAIIIVLATTASLDPIRASTPTVIRFKVANLAGGPKFFTPIILPWARQLADSRFGKQYILSRR